MNIFEGPGPEKYKFLPDHYKEGESIPESVPGRLDKMKSLLSKKVRAAVLAGLTILSVGGQEANTYSQTIEPKTKIAEKFKPTDERIKMLEKVEPTTIPDQRKWWKGEGWEWHVPFATRDQDGSIHSGRWWQIFIPMLETQEDVTEKENTGFEIPFEFSRLFEAGEQSGKAVKPEDQEKVVEYIDQKLKEKFVDNLDASNIFPGESAGMYRSQHPDELGERHGKITGIKVIGTASPEGPASKGYETIKEGFIDEENLRLAYKRAESASEFLKESLEKQGITVDQLVQASKNISAEELQLIDNERAVLMEHAKNYPGAEDDEKIWNLVKDYNLLHRSQQSGEKEKLTLNELDRVGNLNPKAVEDLDKIIASKRKVIIEIEYEGSKKERSLTIFPWILLGLLAFRWPKRQPDNRPPKVVPEDLGPEPTPEPIPGESKPEQRFNPGDLMTRVGEDPVVGPPKSVEQSEDLSKYRIIETTDLVRTTVLPPEKTAQYDDIEYETYVNDLWLYMDNQEDIDAGIDYKWIADEMELEWKKFKNHEDRELFWTDQVLNSWIKGDAIKFQKIGFDAEKISEITQYKNQPKQIMYARMHAKALLRLVQVKRERKEVGQTPRTYMEDLQDMVSGLIDKRDKQLWRKMSFVNKPAGESTF